MENTIHGVDADDFIVFLDGLTSVKVGAVLAVVASLYEASSTVAVVKRPPSNCIHNISTISHK